MALKITAPVYSDKGLTNECYVRINGFNFDKINGQIIVNLGIYPDNNVADSAKPTEIGLSPIMQIEYIINTPMIPNNLVIDQYREEQRTREVDRGSKGIEIVTETFKVADFSEFYSAPDSFAFLYGKIKDKLVPTFGDENIIDI